MAPCGAGDLSEGEARAKKHVEKHAGAESVRLAALVPLEVAQRPVEQ